jgi:hypothetical protein
LLAPRRSPHTSSGSSRSSASTAGPRPWPSLTSRGFSPQRSPSHRVRRSRPRPAVP